VYKSFRVKKFTKGRPDFGSAIGDRVWSQTADGAGVLDDSTLELALYWRQIYSEMLEMEERVLARIDLLMDTPSEVVKRELELTNVPVVVAQAERFRQRLGYWEARITELDIQRPAADTSSQSLSLPS
jgi:hypothetical protein